MITTLKNFFGYVNSGNAENGGRRREVEIREGPVNENKRGR